MFCCPGCGVSRRVFLSGAAGLALAGTRARSAFSADAPPQRWIDVHCHVFNALDLPGPEFIATTRIDPSDQQASQRILACIIGILSRPTPTAAAEIALLDSQMLGPAAGLPQRATQLATTTTLTALQGKQVLPPPDTGNRHATTPFDGPAVVTRALAEVGQDFNRLVSNLQRNDALRQFIQWGDGFTNLRSERVNCLRGQFGAADEVMLTPSLVDYNRWLGITRAQETTTIHITPIEEQVEVMAKVSALHARGTPATPVFTFMPFDPWRWLEEENEHPNLLDKLLGWLDQGKVIGAKLYPPMGFAPLGNADRPIDGFPPQLTAAVRPRHPGVELDRAMRALFAFCVAHDVPIMAHCADSEFPKAAGNADWASPGFWRLALIEYPTLRLNLGHFGGVWYFGDEASPSTAQAHTWARMIAEMMGQFPNLYADVAYASQFLQPNAAQAQATVKFLNSLDSIVSERLMYGSDWEMVGQELYSDRYATLVPIGLSDMRGFSLDAFRWRNAARFLGLGAGQATRKRMERFIQSAGGDVVVLQNFDPALG